MEVIELKEYKSYDNKKSFTTLEDNLMREEVMDRISDIINMIKKSKLNIAVDYPSQFAQLKNKFTMDKAFTLMENMQNDKQLQIYASIYNQIKTYYIEILQLYMK
jgi:hypothetical protein